MRVSVMLRFARTILSEGVFMKSFFLTILISLVVAAAATAQSSETVSLRAGQQKAVSHGDLRVQFLSVLEDSRCPEGVQCVWAGNARIRIKVTKGAGGEPQLFELNTIGNTTATFEGCLFALTDLKPGRRADTSPRPSDYIATITVSTTASSEETLSIKKGSQKRAAGGELTIKFVSVLEDSRCPMNAKCITAGNAKIRVTVSDRHGHTKTMEMNTNAGSGRMGDQFDVYSINLDHLSPDRVIGGRPRPLAYTATINVVRISR
jgi:hypothetical protein